MVTLQNKKNISSGEILDFQLNLGFQMVFTFAKSVQLGVGCWVLN